MDTPESIARDLVEDPMCSVCETSMEVAIVVALKRQRVACANAVNKCNEDTSGRYIKRTDAHEACMNAEEL